MPTLTALPIEVLEQLLLRLDPVDVAHVAQCCQSLRLLLYNPKDQLLWRELYLQLPLDDPRECVSIQGERRTEIDWKATLQRFIRARTALCSPSLLCRPGKRLETLNTLLELITWVPPLADIDDENIPNNFLWIVAMLRGNSFFDDIELDPMAAEEERQISARLHTSFGLTVNDTTRPGRLRSRAYVYDMRKYRPENHYGPLNDQQGVNWVHLRAIHHVVSMHIVDIRGEAMNFQFAIFPMSIHTTQIILPPGMNLDEEDDWADISGAWKISFCFCDHRELLRYNESQVDAQGNLDASIFEEAEFGEVFRTLNVMLKKMATVPDPAHPKRPVIHFMGVMTDTTSTMNGAVRMTVDGQVQWNFISGDNGQSVWHSVGIQVGGLRSPFGVLGSWTTIFHDADDPVGPFWMRRAGAVPGLPMNHVSLNVATP